MNNKLIVFVLAGLVGPGVVLGGEGFVFETETILADGEWNSPSAMAVDEAGVIHIAYMTAHGSDSSSKEIHYATNAGGEWAFVPITNNSVREEYPSIALDAAGHVHISFHTGVTTSNKIRYVNNVGGAFGPIIDITGSGYKIVDHEVDGAGTVHFTFTSQTGNGTDEVYYTTWDVDNGVAPLLNLSQSSGSESEPNLELDNDEYVHLAFADGFTTGPLVYLNNKSGSFVEVATGVAGNVRVPMVLVSSENVVSIIYRVSDFLFVIDDGGTGTFGPPTQMYTGSYRPSFYESAAVDAAGLRYIAFASNVGTDGIFFVGETEDGFADPILLAEAPSTNAGASVAVNSSGLLAVSHQIAGFDGMVFAHLQVSTTQVSAACPADLDGSGAIGAADLAILLGSWGLCGGCGADLDGSGNVGAEDLAVLLGSWGPCP